MSSNRLQKSKILILTLPALLTGATFISFNSSATGLISMPFWQPNCGNISNVTSYTTAGSYSYTVPAGIYNVRVAVLGGGGGGSYGFNYTGGGGGSGGYTEKVIPVTPGNSYTVVVGAGGTCSSGIGGGGGASTFSTVLTGCGGGGGAQAPSSSGGTGGGSCGGAGGVPSGDVAAGGSGGGWSGGTFGYTGSTGGAGNDQAGGGGGAGAPGRSGPGQSGSNNSGNTGGNGGAGSAGASGGIGSSSFSVTGSAGSASTLPEGGGGGGGGNKLSGGATGGYGAGAGGGNNCTAGASGFVYIEELSNNFAPCGGVPLPFSFTDQTNVLSLGGTITSNTVTLTGSFGGLTATCGSGCAGISVNGGAFVAGPVKNLKNGDTIAIQTSAPYYFNTSTTASVTIGPTTSGTWTITTGTPAFVWTGQAGDHLWSNTGNWSTGVVPGSSDTVSFDGYNCSGANCNATLDTAVNVKGIQLGSHYTGAITQNSGTTIALGSSGWTQASGTFTGSDANISISSGAFTQSGGTFTASTGEFRLTAPAGGTTTIFSQTAGTFNPNNANLYVNMNAAGCTNGTTYVIYAQGYYISGSFNNIRFAGGHPTTNNTCTFAIPVLTAAGSFTIQRDQANGSIALNTGSIQVAGDVTFGAGTNGGALSVITFNGTTDQNLSQTTGTTIPGPIGINKASGNVILTTDLVLNNKYLSVMSGGLDEGAHYLSGISSFNLASGALDKVQVPGRRTSTSSSYSLGCLYELYGTSVINFAWTNGYCSVTINKTGGGSVSLNANTRFRGGLDLKSGTFNLGSYTFQVDGNITATSGTLNAQTSTFILGGTGQTISTSLSLNKLTKTVTTADTLTFQAGSTITVSGVLTLQGASGNRLKLRSSTPGTQWSLNSSSTRTVSYLDVQDSNNANATAFAAGATSVDSGNNTNWTFP